jgi:hypothetical protein
MKNIGEKEKIKRKISKLEREIRKITSLKKIRLGLIKMKEYFRLGHEVRGKNGKEYLIMCKKMEIFDYKKYLSKIECEETGHVEKNILFSDGYRVTVSCERCNIGYTRPLTLKESKDWNETMKNPFEM